MIKIDLSRVVTPRIGTYLLGIIPGLFFQSSIAIGNPHFVVSVMGRLHEIYPFGPYALLSLFGASSLFVGSGFFLAAWMMQWLVFFGFVLWSFAIRATLGSQWLYVRFAKWQGMPPKQTIFIRMLSKSIFWARQRQFSTSARPVRECLHIATKQLLKKRYEIELGDNIYKEHTDWNVWSSVMGEPLKGYQEAMLMSRTFLGCGLAGFTALYAAPALRERYFIALCAVFTITSLFVSYDLARWNFNAVRKSTLQLKSILLALSKTATAAGKEMNDQESGLSATAGES